MATLWSLEPLISFIIPVKNEYCNLVRTLPSLMASVEHWGGEYEIIVVDNLSTDRTVQLCKENGCLVLTSSANSVAKLRNIGAQNSNGEIIVFLDADCIVDPMWVLNCVNLLTHRHGVKVVGAPAIADMVNGTWVEKSISTIMASAPRPDYPRWIGTSNLFVRYDDFSLVEGFDTSLKTSEDFDFCCRINDNGKRVLLNKENPVIHLGESKTLRGYFKKEYWRGSGEKLDFFTFFSGGVYNLYLASCIVLFFAFWGSLLLATREVTFLFATLLLLMPLIYVFGKTKSLLLDGSLVKLYIVASVYLMARSVAIVSLFSRMVYLCCRESVWRKK